MKTKLQSKNRGGFIWIIVLIVLVPLVVAFAAVAVAYLLRTHQLPPNQGGNIPFQEVIVPAAPVVPQEEHEYDNDPREYRRDS